MSPDEMMEYQRIQREKQLLQKKRRKRKQKMIRGFFYSILMIAFCLGAFLLGKRSGIREANKDVQAMSGREEVPYQIYRIGMEEGEEASDLSANNGLVTEGSEKRDGTEKSSGSGENDGTGENNGSGENDGVHQTDGDRKSNDAGLETLNDSALVLVNKSHPLPEGYDALLVTLPDGRNRAAKEAYEPLCNMLEAGEKEGLHFVICSSYRDNNRQKELFEEDVEALLRQGYSFAEAYEEVSKETMPPGYSEHSTGLAFDIVAREYQMLDEAQAQTRENI